MKLYVLFLLVTAVASEYGCNICGCTNCTFANPTGVVNFVYDNKAEKRPCTLLQQQVENPTIYNRTYCHEVIWKQAYEVCLCYNVEDPDLLLSDIPDYKERSYGNTGKVDYTPPTPCEGDDCDDTDPNNPNGANGDSNDFQSNNNSGSSMTRDLLMVTLMGVLCLVAW